MVTALLSGADALSSSSTLLQQEHSRIAHALDANNYPQTFVSTHSHILDTLIHLLDDREIKYTIVLTLEGVVKGYRTYVLF